MKMEIMRYAEKSEGFARMPIHDSIVKKNENKIFIFRIDLLYGRNSLIIRPGRRRVKYME